MKNKLITLTVLFFASITYAQIDSLRIKRSELKDLAFSFSYYLDGKHMIIPQKKIENPLITYDRELDTLTKYRKDKKDILFTSSSLNYLFSKKVATTFTTSSDLTLQEYFFNIDPSENSLTLAYNRDNRNGDPLKKLNWVYSFGAKVVTKNSFSTLPFIGDSNKSDLGFNFKISKIRNGWISYNTKEGIQRQIDKNLETSKKIEYADELIKLKREFLFYEYNHKVKEFNNSLDLKKKIQYIKASEHPTKVQEKIEEYIKEKAEELYYEMITQEIQTIETEGLYTNIAKSWYTYEIYIPFGKRDYNITPILATNKASNASYYPFKTSISSNFFIQNKKNYSLFGKFTGTYKNNNTIEVNGSSEKEFQSITTINNVSTLTEPVKAIDVSNLPYSKFTTTSLKGELAFFFIKNVIGISTSIEKNFGKYEGVNYKIGIPFSLKDKEGKPKVNFEVQYKHNETFGDDVKVIGISTSFFFGDLLN